LKAADGKALHKPGVCEAKYALNDRQFCNFTVKNVQILKGRGGRENHG